MHKTIVSIKYFPYLCIRQLVILIYIYHFPKRNKPSVRIAYFLFAQHERILTGASPQAALTVGRL